MRDGTRARDSIEKKAFGPFSTYYDSIPSQPLMILLIASWQFHNKLDDGQGLDDVIERYRRHLQKP